MKNLLIVLLLLSVNCTAQTLQKYPAATLKGDLVFLKQKLQSLRFLLLKLKMEKFSLRALKAFTI